MVSARIKTTLAESRLVLTGTTLAPKASRGRRQRGRMGLTQHISRVISLELTGGCLLDVHEIIQNMIYYIIMWI